MLATPDTSWHRAHPPGLPSARATSHADPKAAATDGHRNPAAYATTAATPPKSCPLLRITSP